MVGYSGKPLSAKLGLKPGMKASVVGAPPHYASLLGAESSLVSHETRILPNQEFLHVFTSRRAELVRLLGLARKTIRPNGMIWVSWPKKASKVPTDITEDVIREVCLPMDLVDVKVCAVDETWSGLKLVILKEKRDLSEIATRPKNSD